MYQYENLLKNILDNGEMVNTRNGGRLTIYGYQMRFNLKDGFPIVTTSKKRFDWIVQELIWFLNGETNTKQLKEWGNPIWDLNADENGNLKKIYGMQWRRWESTGYTKPKIINRRLITTDTKPYKFEYKLLDIDYTNSDDLVGTIQINNTGEQYRVIKKLDKINAKNSEYLIQFDNGAVREASRPNIRSGVVKNYYTPNVYGVGCVGNNNFTPSYRKKAYDLWNNMMARCYNIKDPNYHNYGGKGIGVSNDWKCFENFLADLCKIPGYENWLIKSNKYELDKDYYGSNGYSLNTCVFLSKQDNVMYATSKPIKVTVDNVEYLYESASVFAKEFMLDNRRVSEQLNGIKVEYPEYKIEFLNLDDNKILRRELFIDQIQRSITLAKKAPYSTRNIVTAWNPSDMDEMKLPPCHKDFQIHCLPDNKLILQFSMRSTDAALGLPYNISSYALLAHLYGIVLNREPIQLICDLGNVHLYESHIENARKQVLREPYELPQLNIKHEIPEDLKNMQPEWFELIGYKSHPYIKYEMVV